jgi:Zn-finger in ubiquitin-hydrolases and other protein
MNTFVLASVRLPLVRPVAGAAFRTMSVPSKNFFISGHYRLDARRAVSFENIGTFTNLLPENEATKWGICFVKIAPCTRHCGRGMCISKYVLSAVIATNQYIPDAVFLFDNLSFPPFFFASLTCGFVGCGRYSNKHSVAHFEQTKHPYSLELATLRVWDYCLGEYGGFVQRSDLLECPSSPPLSHPWMIRGLETDGSFQESERTSRNHMNGVAYGSVAGPPTVEVEKSSKKAVMIGEEYEALLQSALEEQAQHYEGEITKLRAELTAALVDKNSMSPEEVKEFESLTAEIEKTRREIEAASKALLEAQAQEAGLRANSQRLLREQQESNELLQKIQEEHRRENEQGKLQIEDLEQQVADLSANLRMRQQFSQNDELNNAQIFGTTASPDRKQSGGKRGKKKGRIFRK